MVQMSKQTMIEIVSILQTMDLKTRVPNSNKTVTLLVTEILMQIKASDDARNTSTDTNSAS